MTLLVIFSHNILKINAKLILNDCEPSSQDGIQTSHLQDGLRILARIIARDLLARRSADAKRNDAKADDTPASTGS
ncbi:hypothetical protein ACFL4C_02350 [Candidatus Omnitrophota bacterium]